MTSSLKSNAAELVQQCHRGFSQRDTSNIVMWSKTPGSGESGEMMHQPGVFRWEVGNHSTQQEEEGEALQKSSKVKFDYFTKMLGTWGATGATGAACAPGNVCLPV